MNIILQSLRTDHHNMARLLVFMRNSVQLVKQADFGEHTEHIRLLCDCIEYMATYPDEIHHPKEDILFDQLKKRDGATKTTIENLQAEHRLLACKTQELREIAEAIDKEHIVPQHRLAMACFDYIDMQFRHMRYEEDTVFPKIEQKLTLKDWKSILKSLPSGDDPLFNDKRSEFYDSLHSNVSESYQGKKTLQLNQANSD